MSNDWEVVQEKAFTAWVNGVLDRVGERVDDITADFSDGIKLVHFLELLSNKKIGKKLELERKTEIYRIQNLYLALQFVEKEMEVRAEGVSAEDFVKGNRKLVLGFLWTLYRKYRIAVIKEGDKSSEEGLLLWCKNVTSDYTGVDIKSFKTGFRDGNAFLALAHKYNPDAFDYDAFSKESPEARLEKAFEIAEKTINIPKLLDINEVMKGSADERSLILYTSLFFHAFSAQAQREALEASQRETQDKLGSLENSLTSAKQTREEMLRQLADLEKNKEDLEASNSTKDGQIAELTEENTKLKGEVSDLKGEVSELKAKGSELESNLSSLDSKSKSEHQDLSLQIDTTKKTVAELEARIVELEETIKELKLKLETSEKLNEELTEKLRKSEEEKEALRVKLEGERDSERLKLANALLRLDEETKRADAEFSALLLLRQQFDQHVLDMHRWRKLLEVDNIADFPAEIKTPLEVELAKQGAFDVQVKMLRGKLEDETTIIQKYLREKEEFEKLRLKVDKKK